MRPAAALALVLAPFAAFALALVVFARGCEDDWCAAIPAQAALWGAPILVVALATWAWARRGPAAGLRAVVAAWLAALTAAALGIAGAQAYERDAWMTLVFAAAAALTFAALWMSLRSRRASAKP